MVMSYIKSVRFLIQYYLGIGLTSKANQYWRLHVCGECPYRFLTFGYSRCGVCGCFLRPKSALKRQACPEGRWE